MKEQAPGAGQSPESLPAPESALVEQAAFFDAHPERITGDYLNNFRFRMPAYRERFDFGSPLDTPQAFSDPFALLSDQRKGGTLRNFFADVDRAIQASSVTMDTLAAAYQREQKEGSAAALNDCIIPIYLEMRKMGYRHYDLVV